MFYNFLAKYLIFLANFTPIKNMDSNFEILIGEGGRQYLIHEDFIYILDCSEDGFKQLICISKSCKGALYTNEENVILKRIIHSHSTVPDKILALKTQSLSEINTKKEQPDLLIGDDMEKILSADFLKDVIYRNINLNVECALDGYNDIPEVLQIDIKGNRFLRYDSSMEDNERFIIFFSEFKRSYIPNINTFVVDGTLKSTPKGFGQLLVLHGHIFGRTFPFIYILLEDKSEKSYLRAFNKCKDLANMNVKNIVTDLETELINALKTSFPEAEFNGCLTHLNQLAYKTVERMGHLNNLRKDQNYNLAFKKILNLALVPSQDMLTFYEDIKKFIDINSIRKIKKFLRYFKRNFLEMDVKKEDNEEKTATIMNFWNAFNRVKNDIPITTNSAKYWNRIINLNIGTLNPNMSVFISKILESEEEDIYNLKRCRKTLFGISKTCKLQMIIRHFVTNYNFFSRDDYMNILLHNVNFRYG
jgi:hypothetical protein